MDSIAFIIALGAPVAVLAWFILNEERKGGDALGLFAIRAEEAARNEAAGPRTSRYRRRERLKPAHAAELRGGEVAKSYRLKSAVAPAYQSRTGDA